MSCSRTVLLRHSSIDGSTRIYDLRAGKLRTDVFPGSFGGTCLVADQAVDNDNDDLDDDGDDNDNDLR